MTKLNYFQTILCQLNARTFKNSVKRSKFSSPIFIRKFMNSDVARLFDDESIMNTSDEENAVIEEIDSTYEDDLYGTIKYDEDVMYWIGYIYRTISLMYSLSSKKLYKLFPAQKMADYYYVYHTFDVEYAAERMLESINYQIINKQEETINVVKRLVIDVAK